MKLLPSRRVLCTPYNHAPKLQALVYDILPLTTAVFSYATGSRKLSANEQFFAGAQTVVYVRALGLGCFYSHNY